METSTSNRRRRKWIIATAVVAAVVVLSVASIVKVLQILPGIHFAHSARFEKLSDSTASFRYQPERLFTGKVLHYRKSNIDGSRPVSVSLYASSVDTLEAFKVYPGTSATYYVQAKMDWSAFCPKTLIGYDIRKDGRRHQAAKEELSPHRHSYRYSAKGSDTKLSIAHLPVHNYNFDLSSLNFSFSQLVDPEGEFELGMIYPSFSLISYVKDVYAGTVKVRFIKEESYEDKACRKYSIGGQGLLGKEGFIWVNREGGYIVGIEIPLSDNPLWKSFKLALLSVEKMTPQEWKGYVARESSLYLGIAQVED